MNGPQGWLGDFGAERAQLESAATHTTGTLRCAIEGRPWWSDERLAATARAQGHAAALAEAWATRGPELTSRLHGAFALAVIEPATRTAFLAIDRMGVHALYYAAKPAGLVFAPTPAAVAAQPGVGRTVSPAGILHYFNFWWIPAPATIFAEQKKLQPAECLLWRDGSIATRFYWHMPYERASEPANVDDLAAELHDRLRAAMRRAVANGDAAGLGTFLSGGLDSSTVAGLFEGAAGRPARTFTIAYDDAEFDESRYATLAAERFHTRHTQNVIGHRHFFEAVESVAQAAEEPFANTSMIAAHWCARFAREAGVTAMLAGDGGDELFAGNARYVRELWIEAYRRAPGLVRGGLAAALEALPADRATLLRRARSFARYAALEVPERLHRHSHFGQADLSDIFADGFLSADDKAAPLGALREVYERTASPDALHRMMHLDLKLVIADGDVRKVNTACRAAGVSVRYPFLDDGLVEFAARIPAGVLMPHKRLRGFYKRAMRGFLPDAIIDKPKHGFGMPTVPWIQANRRLESLALDCLADFRKRGWMKPEFLDQVEAFYRTAPAHSRAAELICDVMFLELWLKGK